MTLTKEEMFEIAKSYLDTKESGIELVIIEGASIVKDYGIVFFYNSKEFLETGDRSTARKIRKRKSKEGSIYQSYFENLGVKLEIENTIKLVSGQTKGYTCVANSLRMVLSDLGKIEFEDSLALALKTDKNGAHITDIPKAVESLGIQDVVMEVHRSHKGVTVSTLEKALKNGERSAVVSVYNKDFGGHAIVVDRIYDGQVFIRDPMPLNQGSSYRVSVDDFRKSFRKKYVTFKLK